MKLNVLCLIAAAGLTLAGCNKAESPAEVQHDVADARADAQRDVADAQADARENMADAQKDVADAAAKGDNKDLSDASQNASKTQTENEFKVAVARAEANHKVAVEKCEALNGMRSATARTGRITSSILPSVRLSRCVTAAVESATSTDTMAGEAVQGIALHRFLL